MIAIELDPVPAPRQVRSDVWKKRPCVMRYRYFRDEMRKRIPVDRLTVPMVIEFVIAMPPSWSSAKKLKMLGRPHCQKPDIDNIGKSVLDSLFEDDSHIHSLSMNKIWGLKGEIRFLNHI